MADLLNIVSSNTLTDVSSNEISALIDKMIEKSKNNAEQISELTLECTSLLTSAQNKSDSLSSQGTFKRLLGEVTGKNKKLQNAILNDNTNALYAAQTIINKVMLECTNNRTLLIAVNDRISDLYLELKENQNDVLAQVAMMRKGFVAFYQEFLKENEEQLKKIEKLESYQKSMCPKCGYDLISWQRMCPNCGYIHSMKIDNSSDETKKILSKLSKVLTDDTSSSDIMWDVTAMKTDAVIRKVKLLAELGKFPSYPKDLVQDMNILMKKCRSAEFQIAVVGVMKVAVAIVVTMNNIASCIEETAVGLPFVEVSVERDVLIAMVNRHRSNAFVAADVLHHLHVVVVRPTTFHGSYGSVELCIVLVHEVEGILLSAEEIDMHIRLTRRVFTVLVLACRPLVPVIKIDEVRINLKCFVPTVLEVDAVLRGIVPLLTKPGHKGATWHVLSVKLRFQSLASPALTGNAYRVLSRRDCHLFEASLMFRAKFFRLKSGHILVIQFVPEAPLVLASHVGCSSPTLVAPPHIAKGEELFDLVAVVRLALLSAIRIGINRGRGVVKQQWLAIPIKPTILISRRLVEAFVEALHNIYHVAVECPKAKLRHLVAQSLHFLHGLEEHFPLVPITDGICNVHDEHVNACIGKHREVVEADIAVLAKEVTVLGFAPMIGGIREIRIAFRALRILFEKLRHIVSVRLSIVKILRVPSNIEDANSSRLVCLKRTLLGCRQGTT